MSRRKKTWAVYRSPIKDGSLALAVVCTQEEWEAAKHARPGVYTLIREHIENEADAERLARIRLKPARVARYPDLAQLLEAIPSGSDDAL